MIALLIYVVLALVVIYIVMLLWKIIGFIIKFSIGIFALYFIAILISYVSKWFTKRTLSKEKNNENRNDTPKNLIEEWRKNDEEIKEGKKKDKIDCKIDEEKTKGKMSDEEALKYAIYCNAYMEHKDEMRKYGIEEE